MASFTFHRLKRELSAGAFDWTTADLRMILLGDGLGFTEDPSLDSVDALDGELVAAGYARQAVTGRTLDRDDVEGLTRWLADDVVFPELGPGAVAGAVIYVHGASDLLSWPAIYLADVVADTNGTDFTVTLDELGVVRIRDAA